MKLCVGIRIWSLALCSSILMTTLMGKTKPPEWLGDLAGFEDESMAEDHGAVVLVDESEYDYFEKGVAKSSTRKAIKFFDKKERDRADIGIVFEDGHSEVTHFRAWLIDSSGKVYKYQKKDTFDVATGGSNLHSTQMQKVLVLSDSIKDGSVVAYEYKLKKQTVFSQIHWTLNQSIPVLNSVVTVVPPKGWIAECSRINGAEAEEKRLGDAYVWSAKDLDAVEFEERGLPPAAVGPWLGINLQPLEGSERSVLKSYSDWASVATEDALVNDEQIVPNDAIRAKTKELCENVSGEWETLEAIGEFAQSVNYVSIATDLSLGGGYKPFTAAEVLERHYGDCKDKTALARSLFKCLDIESYAVSCDSGYKSWVDPAWPSLSQFNHCIVAISVSDEVDSPAVMEHETLGRLLLFDPTSQNTPFGLLPSTLYGTKVLIASDKVDGLTDAPRCVPEDNLVSRSLSLKLYVDGVITGQVKEISNGVKAVSERALYRGDTETEYGKRLRRWVSEGATATVDAFTFEDDFEANETSLEVDFVLPNFARSMRGKFLVFKPFLLGVTQEPSVSVEDRTQPYRFYPRLVKESIEIEIPDGFEVDDMSKPVELETDFARYEARYEEKDGALHCVRTIQMEDTMVSVERYAEVVDFFDAVAKFEQAPVLLAAK